VKYRIYYTIFPNLITLPAHVYAYLFFPLPFPSFPLSLPLPFRVFSPFAAARDNIEGSGALKRVRVELGRQKHLAAF